MAQVHTFSLDNELFLDTRVPFQYRGGAKTNTRRAFELSALVDFVAANMTASPFSVQSATVSNNGTVAVSAGRMVAKIVVIGASSGNFNLGTTASGTEILDGETFDTDGAVYALDRYFHSGGTLHFSGGFSGSLTVKLILVNLS
jgi:hypothetical protein